MEKLRESTIVQIVGWRNGYDYLGIGKGVHKWGL